jgi:hypothetical protein
MQAESSNERREKKHEEPEPPDPSALAARWLEADGFPAVPTGGPLPSVFELAALMVLGRIPFPFKRESMPDPRELYAAARRTGFSRAIEPVAMVPDRAPCAGTWGFDGKPFSLQISASAYASIDQITDYFTEYARVAARVCGWPSPLAAWSRPDYAIEIARAALAASSAREQKLDAHALREAVYAAVPECTQFKVSLAWWVFRHFRAAVVLDPCAGWGDRLIGAAAAGVRRYLGADPNEALRKGHAEIVRTLLPAERQKAFTVECTPFEALDLVKAGYCGEDRPDLVFTSPPFFDFEVYADGAQARGQSTEGAAGFDAWLRGFLLPALDKMWLALRPGGHLVLYLKDAKGIPLCEAVRRHVEDRLGGVHRATIACYRVDRIYRAEGRLRQCRAAGGKKGPNAVPLWVWHKRGAGAFTRDPV